MVQVSASQMQCLIWHCSRSRHKGSALPLRIPRFFDTSTLHPVDAVQINGKILKRENGVSFGSSNAVFNMAP